MDAFLRSDAALTATFHEGERAVHQRLGLGPRIGEIAARVFRPVLPAQHRAFYGQLPFIVIGSVDEQARPWASLLVGRSGFITAPDEAHLRFEALPVPGDPLAQALHPGAPLGLLGMELHTRRRNRVNGHVGVLHKGGFTLDVDQAVGNCPQYIHPRQFEWVREPTDTTPRAVERLERLDDEARSFIHHADTLFVATHAPAADSRPASTDVSHRGGPEGFVRVENERELLVPDYRGNFFFMTLGNLQLHARAGLLFIDWSRGDLLMLTGSASVLWDDAPEVATLDGAQRAWRFGLEAGWRLRDALPLRWREPA